MLIGDGEESFVPGLGFGCSLGLWDWFGGQVPCSLELFSLSLEWATRRSIQSGDCLPRGFVVENPSDEGRMASASARVDC